MKREVRIAVTLGDNRAEDLISIRQMKGGQRRAHIAIQVDIGSTSCIERRRARQMPTAVCSQELTDLDTSTESQPDEVCRQENAAFLSINVPCSRFQTKHGSFTHTKYIVPVFAF